MVRSFNEERKIFATYNSKKMKTKNGKKKVIFASFHRIEGGFVCFRKGKKIREVRCINVTKFSKTRKSFLHRLRL